MVMDSKVLAWIGAVLFTFSATGQIDRVQSSQPPEFEGQLTYELHVGGREWTVNHLVRAEHFRTEVRLGETLFQSFIHNEEGTYLVDDLGKKMHLISLQDSAVIAGTAEDADPLPVSKDQGSGLTEKVTSLSLTSEGSAFGQKTLVYRSNQEVASFVMVGMPGIQSLPPRLFLQFKDLRKFAPVILRTLRPHRLIPASIEIEDPQLNLKVEMRLTGLEQRSISERTFDLPSGYSVELGDPNEQ